MLAYIAWDANPEIFSLGPLTIRWYGLLFALGFLLGQQVLIRLYKAEGKPESDVEVLTVYMVVSTIIGARLGHMLFYQPEVFWQDPVEILYIWKGGLASHGAGIAIFIALYIYVNYGVAFFDKGKFLRIWKRLKPGQTYLWITDRMVITVALAGCCIRFGNLMNSEIIGKPSDAPWAFVFAFPESSKPLVLRQNQQIISNIQVSTIGSDTLIDRIPRVKVSIETTFLASQTNETIAQEFVETALPDTLRRYSRVQGNSSVELLTIPHPSAVKKEGGVLKVSIEGYGKTRHPAQLYESISCFILFFFLYWYWSRRKAQTPEGSLTGLFMMVIFTLRFFYEFLKEPQVDFENSLIADIGLNVGQLLSIPAVAFGIFLWLYSRRGTKASVKA
ncbi:MAG: prolipoprotein diacylglyceryl transferase [Bacteroidota bacterium]